MDKKYYAHTLEGKASYDRQPLEEHLKNVAELARAFAGSFSAGCGNDRPFTQKQGQGDRNRYCCYTRSEKNRSTLGLAKSRDVQLDFMFQLTKEEYQSLRSQFGTLKRGTHSKAVNTEKRNKYHAKARVNPLLFNWTQSDFTKGEKAVTN